MTCPAINHIVISSSGLLVGCLPPSPSCLVFVCCRCLSPKFPFLPLHYLLFASGASSSDLFRPLIPSDTCEQSHLSLHGCLVYFICEQPLPAQCVTAAQRFSLPFPSTCSHELPIFLLPWLQFPIPLMWSRGYGNLHVRSLIFVDRGAPLYYSLFNLLSSLLSLPLHQKTIRHLSISRLDLMLTMSALSVHVRPRFLLRTGVCDWLSAVGVT